MLTDDLPMLLSGISDVIPRARLVEFKHPGERVTINRVQRPSFATLRGPGSPLPDTKPDRTGRIEVAMTNSIEIGSMTVKRGREIGMEIGTELQKRGVDTGSLNCIIAVRRDGHKLTWGQAYEVQPVATAGVPA